MLSQGEKVRLYFCKLVLKKANLLILDEPTNHLDILGKEALEDALLDYDGTLLFVSHDRYFIRKIATSILKIEDGCKVDAIIVGENKKATLTINIERLPNQKAWIGKKVGDVLETTSATLSYRVERIYKE